MKQSRPAAGREFTSRWLSWPLHDFSGSDNAKATQGGRKIGQLKIALGFYERICNTEDVIADLEHCLIDILTAKSISPKSQRNFYFACKKQLDPNAMLLKSYSFAIKFQPAAS